MRSINCLKLLTICNAIMLTPITHTTQIKIDDNLSKKLTKATILMAQLDCCAYVLPQMEFISPMFIKKEAIMSSQIEGIQVSFMDLLASERGIIPENPHALEQVLNYINAIDFGIKQSEVSEPALLYFYYPGLIECALEHTKFETAQPLLINDGRAARLGITLSLHAKGIIQKPLLCLSSYFKKNKKEYHDRLAIIEYTNNYEQWVEFFLNGLIEAGQAALDGIKAILALQYHHQHLLFEKRISTPMAMMLLDKLCHTPIIDIKDVQNAFDVSHPTASHLITQFVDLGILQEISGKQRSRRYAYTKYLDILSEGTNPL